MMKKLLILFCVLSSYVFAQCPAGQKQVVVTIVPDNYPAEITWNLKDNAGVILASGTSVSQCVCRLNHVFNF